ncbi:hypothetical protein BX666DRAFT_1866799 [Dichotomocladium elegans]|nr:hypothetical protein BX666DRAFT_1866799 [Dichotomocladium elegans]
MSPAEEETKGKLPQLLYEPNAPDYRSSEVKRQTLFDKLAADVSLSTFMDILLQVESVLQVVNGSSTALEPFTLFCPVNAAFRQSDAFDASAEMAEWEAFLRKHLVPFRRLNGQELKHPQQLDALLGTINVTNDKDDRPLLNHRARVIRIGHPIDAPNGIAYRIDAALQ